MSSAFAAVIGLLLAIVLIIVAVPPVYSLLLGALMGGIMAGTGLEGTVAQMVSGVKDMAPAILRILAAGVLSGVLIKTGAAKSISSAIVKVLGPRQVFLALALSTMILTTAGVFIDVAVITVAPIALAIGRKIGQPDLKLLFAMIAGGKCGNVISPNPNTIVAAENFGAPLSSVMVANIIPAILGLLFVVFVLIPLFPAKWNAAPAIEVDTDAQDDKTPSFLASICGPVAAILLLALRPIAKINIDPLIALPAGGFACVICTGTWKSALKNIQFGLEKMTGVTILLIGTGALAGIIKASTLNDSIIAMISNMGISPIFLAPLAGTLMSAATASTTAGATVASASFAPTILDAGLSPVSSAAAVNAGATVLDHLPHGSFFHATGGSMGFSISQRIKLIPFETLTGLFLCAMSLVFSA